MSWVRNNLSLLEGIQVTASTKIEELFFCEQLRWMMQDQINFHQPILWRNNIQKWSADLLLKFWTFITAVYCSIVLIKNKPLCLAFILCPISFLDKIYLLLMEISSWCSLVDIFPISDKTLVSWVHDISARYFFFMYLNNIYI